MLTVQGPENSHMYITKSEKPSAILQIFACKCPRCRQGYMFSEKNPWKLKKTMDMNEACPVCGQSFNPEVGFYFGSSYISYAITVALSVASFIGYWVLIAFPFSQHHIFYWLIMNALLLIALQPYLMRIGRTGWLSFFVRYDAEWSTNPPAAPERTNKDQENNW
jgi:uncharacterized protein (DUF983 family)